MGSRKMASILVSKLLFLHKSLVSYKFILQSWLEYFTLDTFSMELALWQFLTKGLLTWWANCHPIFWLFANQITLTQPLFSQEKFVQVCLENLDFGRGHGRNFDHLTMVIQLPMVNFGQGDGQIILTSHMTMTPWLTVPCSQFDKFVFITAIL